MNATGGWGPGADAQGGVGPAPGPGPENGPAPGPAPDPTPQPSPPVPPRSTPSPRPTRRVPTRERKVLGWVLLVVVLLGVAGAGWAVPEVRGGIRDSFRERGQAYIELYFRRDPRFDGGELVVPLALVEYGDSGGRHKVLVRVQGRGGRRVATRAVVVSTKPGALISTDVRLRVRGGKRAAELVDVTLPGRPQRLRMHLP